MRGNKMPYVPHLAEWLEMPPQNSYRRPKSEFVWRSKSILLPLWKVIPPTVVWKLTPNQRLWRNWAMQLLPPSNSAADT